MPTTTRSVNDRIVLDGFIEQQREARAPDAREDDYFELFVAEQVLKDEDLTDDELQSGIIGGGGDGGIDGFYFLLDGNLVMEDPPVTNVKRIPMLRLVVIQAKRSPTFDPAVFGTLKGTLDVLLDLTKKLEDYRHLYRPDLLEKASIFRTTFINLASKHPNVKILVVYGSKGDASTLPQRVRARRAELAAVIRGYFPNSDTTIECWGASELLERAQTSTKFSLDLKLKEAPIPGRGVSYVALVDLADYFDFITDDEQRLRKHIFEANVRDFQGDVEVNEEIRESVVTRDALDFWWLNNGVTIVASKATLSGKTASLEDVQVVNGLQTSEVLYSALRGQDEPGESRSLLVRIIVAEDDDARNRIIKATNTQTPVPAASLRATEPFQRKLEEYFGQEGLYYDRRKNHCKNLGLPVEKIVSIPFLAQCVMAVALAQPNNARARPSSLLKDNDDYARVFNPDYPISLYTICVRVVKRVDAILKTDGCPITPGQRTNFRFHVATYAVMKALHKSSYQITDVALLDIELFDDAFLTDALGRVECEFARYGREKGFSEDRTSKNAEFVTWLAKAI